MVPEIGLRTAMFEWLAHQVELRGRTLPWDLLSAGFPYRDERVPLISQSGIWKPARCTAPLSIMTSADGPYEDRLTEDSRLEYHYRGNDPGHFHNRAMHVAMEACAPLVYLFKVVKGQYLVEWPAYVVGDDPSRRVFTMLFDDLDLATGDVGQRVQEVSTREDAEPRRRYVTATVLKRLHQDRFRIRVLRAYRERCALCRLRHQELLEAAHILPDSEHGPPEVRNGLALCKLHHAAFDRYFIGVRPHDYVVEVRDDVLREEDGPMLQHGLKGMHLARLTVPRQAAQRPDPGFLEWRYGRFRASR